MPVRKATDPGDNGAISAGELDHQRPRRGAGCCPLSQGVSVSRSRMDPAFVHKGRKNGPEQTQNAYSGP
jgi:hypothetical protein